MPQLSSSPTLRVLRTLRSWLSNDATLTIDFYHSLRSVKNRQLLRTTRPRPAASPWLAAEDNPDNNLSNSSPSNISDDNPNVDTSTESLIVELNTDNNHANGDVAAIKTSPEPPVSEPNAGNNPETQAPDISNVSNVGIAQVQENNDVYHVEFMQFAQTERMEKLTIHEVTPIIILPGGESQPQLTENNLANPQPVSVINTEQNPIPIPIVQVIDFNTTPETNELTTPDVITENINIEEIASDHSYFKIEPIPTIQENDINTAPVNINISLTGNVSNFFGGEIIISLQEADTNKEFFGLYNLPDQMSRSGDYLYFEDDHIATVLLEEPHSLRLHIEDSTTVTNEMLSTLLSSLQFMSTRDDYIDSDTPTEFLITIDGKGRDPDSDQEQAEDILIHSDFISIGIAANNDQADVKWAAQAYLDEQQLFSAPQALDPNAIFSDPDNQPHYGSNKDLQGSGGFIFVQHNQMGLSSDFLSILSMGDDLDQIRVDHPQIYFQGDLFAKIDDTFDGQAGHDLKINFISEASTSAAVQALLRSIAYQTNSVTPKAEQSFSIIINQGGSSDTPGDETNETVHHYQLHINLDHSNDGNMLHDLNADCTFYTQAEPGMYPFDTDVRIHNASDSFEGGKLELTAHLIGARFNYRIANQTPETGIYLDAENQLFFDGKLIGTWQNKLLHSIDPQIPATGGYISIAFTTPDANNTAIEQLIEALRFELQQPGPQDDEDYLIYSTGDHYFTPNLILTNAYGIREKFVFQASLIDASPPDILTQTQDDVSVQSSEVDTIMAVGINPENQAPTDLELLYNQINEAARTDLVPVDIGILRAYDAEHKPLTYSIDPDYNNQMSQLFDIVDNMLVLKQGAHIDQDYYDLKITATDNAGGTTSEIIRVNTHRDPNLQSQYRSLRLNDLEHSLIFDENDINQAPKPLFNQAQFSDPYNADFSSGSFNIRYQTTGSSDDSLLVITNDEITLTTNGEIYYLGDHVATRSEIENGQSGTSLHIDFTPDATLDALNALLQTIHYHNSSDTPELTRQLNFTLQTDTNLSTQYSAIITVNPERDDSSFTISHVSSISENEINQAPVDINISVSGKIANLRGGNIRISLGSRSDSEIVDEFIGFYNLPGDFTRDGDSFYYQNQLFATITSETPTDIYLAIIDDPLVTNTTLSGLLSSLQFMSTRDDYSIADITTDFVIMIDGYRAGFTGFSDEVIRFSESRINIIASNDSAEVKLIDHSETSEAEVLRAPQALDPQALFTDIDNQAHFGVSRDHYGHPIGGYVFVRHDKTGLASDHLSILSVGDESSQIRVTDNQIFFEGNLFAEIDATSNGQSGADLKVNFIAEAATSSAIQALLRHVAYQTTSVTPETEKHFSITINQGQYAGAVSAETTHHTRLSITPDHSNDGIILHNLKTACDFYTQAEPGMSSFDSNVMIRNAGDSFEGGKLKLTARLIGARFNYTIPEAFEK